MAGQVGLGALVAALPVVEASFNLGCRVLLLHRPLAYQKAKGFFSSVESFFDGVHGLAAAALFAFAF